MIIGGINIDKIQELETELQQIKMSQKDIQQDIRALETRVIIAEKDISTINKQLEKISANTTWILRLIIGTLITVVLEIIVQRLL